MPHFSIQNHLFTSIYRDKNGKTAIDLAIASENSKLSSLLEKVPCKNPSHNDIPTAPPARRRVRTTSSSTILFLTGFDKTRKESLIKSVQSIFGRKCVATAKNVENNGLIIFIIFSTDRFLLVTHIIACGESDKIAFRTINYLRGIVLGKWIVSEKCKDSNLVSLISFFSLGIDECIKQKQWISENEYEIIGSQLEPDSNGSHLSRIKHEQNVKEKPQKKNLSFFFFFFKETLLFHKCQFYLYGQFHTYKKEDIADLVKITSAVLLKREPKLHRIDNELDSNEYQMTYMIYESSIPENNLLKHITLLDFLACIDYYDIQGRLDN
jgi:hypothetical protein